ncbi:MAG: cation:proton antiporter [Actinomycetes bacterium]
MSTIAWILAIGLLGPLLSLPKKYKVPVAVGEILIGVMFGESGLKKVPLHNANLALFASIGFALVMMTVGSHIDILTIVKQRLLPRALLNQLIVTTFGVPLGYLIAWITGIHLAGVFAVLTISSSAAIVLPIFVSQNRQRESGIATLLAQVAVADLLCIIALPLALGGHKASRLIEGSVLITGAGILVYFYYFIAHKTGFADRIHAYSKQHRLGIELRISLIFLLSLAALAQHFSISVMVAGFAIGLALAANGISHRLDHQLFAISEGFFSPFFFVWLGAEIDISHSFSDRHLLLLTLGLTAATLLAHAATVFAKQPLLISLSASAQLGVPVAAVTIGQADGILSATQGGAIMLAALLTIAVTVVSNTFIPKATVV